MHCKAVARRKHDIAYSQGMHRYAPAGHKAKPALRVHLALRENLRKRQSVAEFHNWTRQICYKLKEIDNLKNWLKINLAIDKKRINLERAYIERMQKALVYPYSFSYPIVLQLELTGACNFDGNDC